MFTFIDGLSSKFNNARLIVGGEQTVADTNNGSIPVRVPLDCSMVMFWLCGAGAGAGGGRASAAGVAAFGGGGGGAGALTQILIPRFLLPDTVYASLGLGGAGGAGGSGSASGSNGTGGGNSVLSTAPINNTTISTIYNHIAYASGGNVGGGGTNSVQGAGGTSATVAANGYGQYWSHVGGGTLSATSSCIAGQAGVNGQSGAQAFGKTVGLPTTAGAHLLSDGGCGGGGVNAGTTTGTGGCYVTSTSQWGSQVYGETASAPVGANGADGMNMFISRVIGQSSVRFNTGGSGGGGNTGASSTGGIGGKGGYGSGGGGGGGANGSGTPVGGTGGQGGDGWLLMVCF